MGVWKLKSMIIEEVENIKQELCKISDFMYYNPELGNEEYEAMKLLTGMLSDHGFEIETGLVGKSTAFRGVYDSKKPGKTIGYLCEYDALPDIGHGCGHNMIGTMSVGAGIALSKVLDNCGGKIVVYGTPAEETDGGKVYMADAGLFDDLDAALILHPADKSYSSGSSLAMDAIEFSFTGKASHAASEPEAGINALDAVIMTFNGINALRQHVTSDVRIHGIISEGGIAANIVPDKGVCRFYVRSKSRAYLDEVVEKVKDIARGAMSMTKASLEIKNYEISYDNMKTDQVLSDMFQKNMDLLEIDDLKPSRESFGSIDMGNVSQKVAAIHPYIGLTEGLVAHTKEFADFTITDKAHDRIGKGASALALTGFDIINN